MGDHALLSASASKRWVACTPSARLTEHLEDKTSEAAEQGTEAHALCEHKLNLALGRPSVDPTSTLSRYDVEMEDCANQYATFILEIVEAAKAAGTEPLVLVEQKLDYSRWAPQGSGTGDCVIVAGDTIHVVDYKHGQGVLVEAEHNTQMMCYALGALDAFDYLYDLTQVSMTIFQPRRDNISTSVISKTELLHWAQTVLAPAAQKAWAGEGDQVPGEHCLFCLLKPTCRARAEANLALAKYEFAPPAELADPEVEAVLAQADQLVTWVSDVRDYALQQALAGKQWANWKLVAGRSIRKYADDAAVAAAVQAAGHNPFEQKLLTITALEKQLGKTAFNQILGGLITKSDPKPTLVPAGDKRPVWNSAARDFADSTPIDI